MEAVILWQIFHIKICLCRFLTHIYEMSATSVAMPTVYCFMCCVPQCGRVKFTYVMYSLRSGCPERQYRECIVCVYSTLKSYEETTRFWYTKNKILGGEKVCALLAKCRLPLKLLKLYITYNNTVPSQCNYLLLFTFTFLFTTCFGLNLPSSGVLPCQNSYTVLNVTHSLHKYFNMEISTL
jgi:hypothetical protein